jgi:hypothetical protein
MTAQEIMVTAYQDAGEPSDLCPFTTPGDESTFSISSAGAVKLLRKLNMAVERIANWRFRNGRLLHLRGLQKRALLTIQAPIAITVQSATANTLVCDPSGETAPANGFYLWTISIDAGTGAGQTRTVLTSVDSTTLALTISKDWDTNPDATSTGTLYKTFFTMYSAPTAFQTKWHLSADPIGGVMDITKIRDIETGTELVKVAREELFSGNLRSVATPTQWIAFGNELWFDGAPDEKTTLEILYQAHATAITTAADIPCVPLQYHQAVCLWLTHDIMRMNSDFDGAYATKRELEDLMETVRAQGESDMDYEQGGLTVY